MPRVRPTLVAAAVLALAAVPATSLAATPHQSRPRAVPAADWPTYHHDQQRTGVGVLHGVFTSLHPRVSWHLPQRTVSEQNDEIYASPLVVGTTAFVTTLENRVYAISLRTGHTVWERTLGAAYTPPGSVCGDIGPTIGIVGTPVIDEARGELFAVAAVGYGAGGHVPVHRLFGLSIRTGRLLLDRVVDPPHQQVVYLLERVSLALDAGRVLFGYGGNDGDCGDYHGWVISVPETGSGTIGRFEVGSKPGQGQGAVWMGGGAPVIAKSGAVYVADGNGSATSAGDAFDYSDAVLKLSPTARLLDYFAPATWYSDNAADLDLGSSQPMLLPDGALIQVGKTQTAYVLNPNHLGHINGSVPTFAACSGLGDDHGGDALVGGLVVLACGGGLDAVRYSAGSPYGTEVWNQSASNGPAVYADGHVWTISGSGGSSGSSTLFALNPNTGNVQLQYNFGAEQNHFPTPAIGDNMVVVASTTSLLAFPPG
jgi:outer membrane protein assembly factor BamB